MGPTVGGRPCRWPNCFDEQTGTEKPKPSQKSQVVALGLRPPSSAFRRLRQLLAAAVSTSPARVRRRCARPVAGRGRDQERNWWSRPVQCRCGGAVGGATGRDQRTANSACFERTAKPVLHPAAWRRGYVGEGAIARGWLALPNQLFFRVEKNAQPAR